MSHAAAQILHGGDSRANAGNRWFDKTLQVIGMAFMGRRIGVNTLHSINLFRTHNGIHAKRHVINLRDMIYSVT